MEVGCAGRETWVGGRRGEGKLTLGMREPREEVRVLWCRREAGGGLMKLLEYARRI